MLGSLRGGSQQKMEVSTLNPHRYGLDVSIFNMETQLRTSLLDPG